MKKLLLLLCAALLCTYSCVAVSVAKQRPLPYLHEAGLGEFESIPELYLALVKSLNGSGKAFLHEVCKNLNLEPQVVLEILKNYKPDKDSPVRVVILTEDNDPLLTAGLVDGKSVYWRRLKPGEILVLFKIGIQWYPAFRLKCANPVKPGTEPEPYDTQEEEQTAPVPPPPQQSQEEAEEQMWTPSVMKTGTWQTGETRVEKDVISYGHISGDNGGAYTSFSDTYYTYIFPKRWITAKDHEQFQKRQKGEEK